MTAPTLAPTVAPGLQAPPLIKVTTPTGSVIEVMGQDEQQHYEAARDAYLSQISFTVQSDFADLDRVLFMELMCHRWGRWMSSGLEYDGMIVTDKVFGELRRMMQDYNDRITRIKESLKLDRKGRESDNQLSFAQRWDRLAAHAREMGIHREHQLDVALEIMQGLFGVVAAYDRSDDEERKKLGFPNEKAIVDFIRQQRPAFDEVDEHFRQHVQKLWVGNP